MKSHGTVWTIAAVTVFAAVVAFAFRQALNEGRDPEEQLSLKWLNGRCTPSGTIRFMRKGRRCRVHLIDLITHLRCQTVETLSDGDINQAYEAEKRKAAINRSKGLF